MRRANRYVVPLFGVAGATLLLSAPVWASSGGTGLSPSKGSSGKGTGPSHSGGSGSSAVQPANVTVSASGDGITIATRASTSLHEQLHFGGSVPASDGGDVVEIERLGRGTAGAWAPTAQTHARGNGSFSALWSANRVGSFSFRAVVEHGQSAQAAAASPSVTVTVYRSVIATIYGPGFFGKRTACGEALRRKTLGVANRTLPCGTMVSIYYGGRTITVPVIDRGPYANHANYDLTSATARALHMPGTEWIGAAPLARKA